MRAQPRQRSLSSSARAFSAGETESADFGNEYLTGVEDAPVGDNTYVKAASSACNFSVGIFALLLYEAFKLANAASVLPRSYRNKLPPCKVMHPVGSPAGKKRLISSPIACFFRCTSHNLYVS